ncbi:MAG TPA: porin [Noviherbaspirillum sp.]|uniref:porin n=1 Tax=Noviherbaspirillum sp. TaxID=1926288 RepID=UPI002D3C52C0|nr:porin [Noviherbaspirillum sp.]HYD96716.1 porin [Noviherbaspirillum sp.]
MKKSLLALAVFGAFAGAASAQSNVTIYGIADVAIERFDTNATSAQWSLTDGNTSFNRNGSRIGFKGTEDLGGGLSAIFTIENGFNIDNGQLGQGGRIFGRQAFVGLQGGFGAVKFGRQYTPMFLALDSVDPFGTGLAGSITNVFNPNGVRTDNTINFSMSAMGVNGQLAYTLGEQAGSNSLGRQIGLGLGYGNGPVSVQFAYHDANAATVAGADTTTALLGGAFDLGVAKLHAAIQTNKAETPAATTGKNRNWMLGASAPVGAGSVVASFLRGDDRLATNADVDQYALGYIHNLSKRTNVYTSYARLNAKPAGAVDTSIFNVGVQHRF